jgi:hypothetical protein
VTYGEMKVESRTWEVSWANFFFVMVQQAKKNVSSQSILGRSVAIFHIGARKFGCVIP